MKNSPDINDFSKVLIVEGYSDLLFYAEALEHLGLHGQVFIQHFNGNRDIISKLTAFLNPQLLVEKDSIGLILDADLDPASRIQSIQNSLKKSIARDVQLGVWATGPGGEARLGFFVTPDGINPGEIETLVWNAWSHLEVNKTHKTCIESFLSCMQDSGAEAKSPDQGRLNAMMAVYHDDDPRLGPAARANLFNFNSPEFVPLLDFLRQI